MKIIEEHLQKLSARYHAFFFGLQGTIASSLYSVNPLSRKNEEMLEIRLNEVLIGAEEEMLSLIREASSAAKRLSYDIVQEKHSEMSDTISQWESFTEHLSAIQKDTELFFLNRMREDVDTLLRQFREMKLRVSIRTHQGEARPDHLLFSEREKLLTSLSPKAYDSLGRGYDSAYTVQRKANWMMTTTQRQVMFFLLASLGIKEARIHNPDSDNHDKTIQVDDYFELEGSMFHYATKALLVV
ncbi:hypothetical protein ABXV18_24955 [Vibrio owensii]|uniref:hypothetical protein n=1 Tax=Vibrio owensii TaxID=696485 RepID=UPI003392BA64